MTARAHVIRALLIAAVAGLIAAAATSILLPIDREARSIDGRLEALADDLTEAGLDVEDDWDPQIRQQVLRITVTDEAATCETWPRVAAEAVDVAEASDLAHYDVEIRIADGRGGLTGFWGSAVSDDLEIVTAADEVCGVAGITGYGVVADRVELYGEVTRDAIAEAATLVEAQGLLLLQRAEPEA